MKYYIELISSKRRKIISRFERAIYFLRVLDYPERRYIERVIYCVNAC